jgi:hypothetical protein
MAHDEPGLRFGRNIGRKPSNDQMISAERVQNTLCLQARRSPDCDEMVGQAVEPGFVATGRFGFDERPQHFCELVDEAFGPSPKFT